MIDHINKKRIKGEITSRILNLSGVEEFSSIHTVVSEKTSKVYEISSVNLANEIGVIYFNFPFFSQYVYVTLSNYFDRSIVRFLSALEEIRSDDGHAIGDIVTTDDEYLNYRGAFGAIFVPVEVSDMLSGLEAPFKKDGRIYDYKFFIFISKDEVDFYKAHGYEELMHEFEACNRDIFSIPILKS